MEVDKGMEEIEIKDLVDSGAKLKTKYEGCISCLELQDKITKANEKCALLELDIRKKNSVIECLEDKLGFMELKKLKIEDEVRSLKQRNDELLKSIDNKVLKCEKKEAEREIGVWKAKCDEQEIKAIVLQKRLSAGMTEKSSFLPEMYSSKMGETGGLMHGYRGAGGPFALQAETENKANEDKDTLGTPPINTPYKQHKDAEGYKGDHKAGVRKCLDFATVGSPHKNVSPSTPGARPPFGPIDISDSDGDLSTDHMHLLDLASKGMKKVWKSTGVGLERTLDDKELISEGRHAAVIEQQSNEEESGSYIESQPYPRMQKRRKVKRGVAYIVSSESESDSDDNIPICRLRSKNMLKHSLDTLPNRRSVNDSCSRGYHKEHKPRRRIVRVGDNENKGVLGKCSYKSTGSKNDLGIPEMNDSVGKDQMEEDDSGSEGESLGGFIVNSSDISESEPPSNCNKMSGINGTFSGDYSGGSENASESSMAYAAVMSGFRRERKDKMKWEYEAEMLADFAECPKLCMKAVCALYRQQTAEEKSCKSTILLNGRGFSQMHAFSGSALAEFVTDGDPHSDIKKSVEELQEFDSKGIEQCRKFAKHYSKQLFEIYKNEEDPFFHPYKLVGFSWNIV